jgi:hypothetical protein
LHQDGWKKLQTSICNMLVRNAMSYFCCYW